MPGEGFLMNAEWRSQNAEVRGGKTKPFLILVRGPWSVVRGPWSVVRGPWSVAKRKMPNKVILAVSSFEVSTLGPEG